MKFILTAKLSLRNSIFDLDGDFGSKEDLSFTLFCHNTAKNKLSNVNIEPKLQAFEIAFIKKGDFKSFDLKIISGNHF